MKRVLFLAYFFPPAGGAGVQRAEKFVKYLPSQGILPVVITGPTSKEYRWTPQDRSLMKSIPAEVPVHRIEGARPAEAGRIRGRLQRWLRLPNRFSKWWIESATELALQVAAGEELIFATMSPFESGVVAQQLSQKLGIPWVADLRDPWALDEMQIYPTFLHRRLEMCKMKELLSTAAIIVMNTPQASAALKQAFPKLRNKTILSIPNGFDAEDFAQPVSPRTDRKFRIVHTGYLHTDNGLELRKRRFSRLLGGAYAGVDILTRSHTVLLEALERWCAERPDIKHDLEVVFAGKTSTEDRAVADASGIKSLLRFPGYLSHKESVELVRTADLLFLPMHNLPTRWRCRIVPGKTYEYMASGRAILAAVPDGDARDFLNACGTALLCRPDDVAGMVQLLEHAYLDWRTGILPKRNDNFVQQFERQNLTSSLAGAFTSLLATNNAPMSAIKPVLSH